MNPTGIQTYSAQSEVAPTRAKATMTRAVILALGVLMLGPIAVRPAAAQSRDELLQQASTLNWQGIASSNKGAMPSRSKTGGSLYKRRRWGPTIQSSNKP